MIGLVGTSDSIAKCEKSDVLARMLNDNNLPNLGVGEKEIIIWGLSSKANYTYLVSLERSWKGLLLGVKQMYLLTSMTSPEVKRSRL